LLIKVFHDGLLQETLADSYMINANLGDIFNFLISPNWKCGSPALAGSCILPSAAPRVTSGRDHGKQEPDLSFEPNTLR